MMSLSSCNTFLDIKPTDLLVEELAFTTPADFNNALGSAYTVLASGNYYGGNLIALGDVTTDNLKFAPGATGLYQFLQNLNYTTSTGEFAGFFQTAYSAIYRANVILAALASTEVAVPEAQKAQVRAECLMIRAIAHHDLMRAFSQRYKATPDGSHFGVALKTDRSLQNVARNTAKQVYDQIIADIAEARPALPTTGVARFTQRAADALRARVALYMEDWTTAETFATNAITGGPALSTGTTYGDMWKPAEANGEIIFKIQTAVGFATLGRNYYDINGGNDYFAPTDDLRAEYTSGDIRLASFYGVPPTYPRPIVAKYLGTTANPGLVHLKIFRMSEMYLIRAEARVRKSSPDEAGALADLNAIRTARSASTGTESGTTLADAIQIERRKELFLEGHRWFDLVRNQKALSRADCNAVTCSMPANDFRFTFPIPQGELFANPLMQQNPGY